MVIVITMVTIINHNHGHARFRKCISLARLADSDQKDGQVQHQVEALLRRGGLRHLPTRPCAGEDSGTGKLHRALHSPTS